MNKRPEEAAGAEREEESKSEKPGKTKLRRICGTPSRSQGITGRSRGQFAWRQHCSELCAPLSRASQWTGAHRAGGGGVSIFGAFRNESSGVPEREGSNRSSSSEYLLYRSRQ